jgi:uncharacterized FlaG/YvyC family protein
MIMKQDDLTQLKHVGATRMKLLNDLGITTIKQLYEMPLEKLVEIKSIGEHYAKLIKNSVAEYYKEKQKKVPGETASAKERKINQINRNLQKKIKRLNKSLNRVDENLKPLWEKKYLELYIDFKKPSRKLKARLNALGKIQQDLPKKVKKNIIKKADAIHLTLKRVEKKPKKKKYKEITKEIQSFSKMIGDILS